MQQVTRPDYKQSRDAMRDTPPPPQRGDSRVMERSLSFGPGVQGLFLGTQAVLKLW